MTLLTVSHLSKNFGGNRAVDDISFQLAAGQLLALIGPNGAGKSTTFNMVGGQLPATAGSVKFDGIELLGMASRKIAHLGIGRSFQIAATFASLTVVENVQMALLAHRREIYQFWRPAVTRYRPEALELLAQVGMDQQADRPCSELAYGDVKRVELAMSIAGNPRLLLMDEPTAGMAPADRGALMATAAELARRDHVAVLFTEHDMDVVFATADRIMVLHQGRVIADGLPADVRADSQVQAVYLGDDL